MKITTQPGMVNIDSPEISYGNIRDMYTTGDGNGLQLSERLEHKRGEIISLCGDIAEKIYELQDILSAKDKLFVCEAASSLCINVCPHRDKHPPYTACVCPEDYCCFAGRKVACREVK